MPLPGIPNGAAGLVSAGDLGISSPQQPNYYIMGIPSVREKGNQLELGPINELSFYLGRKATNFTN